MSEMTKIMSAIKQVNINKPQKAIIQFQYKELVFHAHAKHAVYKYIQIPLTQRPWLSYQQLKDEFGFLLLSKRYDPRTGQYDYQEFDGYVRIKKYRHKIAGDGSNAPKREYLFVDCDYTTQLTNINNQ